MVTATSSSRTRAACAPWLFFAYRKERFLCPLQMEDARKHLMQQGYTNVSELTKDAQGNWVGSASKDGKTVPVAVDVNTGVTTK